MGVINLGNLVSKLKNSLSGTFVKKTEKATKNAFGIVKIGDNISVSSGKISVPLGTTENPGVLQVGSGLSVADGVVSASASGGMNTYTFYNKTGTGSDESITLESNFSSYKFIQYTRIKDDVVYNGGISAIISPNSSTDFNIDCNGSYTVHVYYIDETHVTVTAPTSASGTTILTLIK